MRKDKIRKMLFIKLTALFFFINLVNGQSNEYPSSGDVTIRNYSPNLILQRSTDAGGFISGIQTKLLNGENNWFFGNLLTNSWVISKGNHENAKLTVLSDGNVGIGTINPLAKLEVNGGSILVRNTYNLDNSSSIMIGQSIKEGNLTTSGTAIGTIIQSAGLNIYGMQFFTQESYLTGQTEKMRILGNGNVGIGTITTGTHKLAVNGSIGAREIKVETTTWPDYVFKKEYDLPTLKEVEKHIAEKGHLKDIPSEEEVLKNGLNLGEMNAKLLRKIEELTIYVIEQNKIIIEQNKRLDKLEKKQNK